MNRQKTIEKLSKITHDEVVFLYKECQRELRVRGIKPVYTSKKWIARKVTNYSEDPPSGFQTDNAIRNGDCFNGGIFHGAW